MGGRRIFFFFFETLILLEETRKCQKHLQAFVHVRISRIY